MTLEERARELADTFVNGMFSGHAELYREELREFLAKALKEAYDEGFDEALRVASQSNPRQPLD